MPVNFLHGFTRDFILLINAYLNKLLENKNSQPFCFENKNISKIILESKWLFFKCTKVS